jgi:CBS domain-containing protein
MAYAPGVDALRAADVMLRKPKTVPLEATVGDVRELLSNPSVQLVLVTSGLLFCGAVAAIPDGAPTDAPAIDYAEADPDTIGPDEPATVAFERTANNPYRRIVVIGGDEELLGLVCLDETRTRFCGIPAFKLAR